MNKISYDIKQTTSNSKPKILSFTRRDSSGLSIRHVWNPDNPVLMKGLRGSVQEESVRQPWRRNPCRDSSLLCKYSLVCNVVSFFNSVLSTRLFTYFSFSTYLSHWKKQWILIKFVLEPLTVVENFLLTPLKKFRSLSNGNFKITENIVNDTRSCKSNC